MLGLERLLAVVSCDTVDEEEPTSDQEPCDLPIDTAADLVGNQRRRLAITVLDELGPMEIRALADAVATIADDDQKSVYCTLWQSHLPKLEKHDVIDRGEQGHHIEPSENFEAFVAFIEDLETRFEDELDGEALLEFDEGVDIVTTRGELA